MIGMRFSLASSAMNEAEAQKAGEAKSHTTSNDVKEELFQRSFVVTIELAET
jgi:hypothetical protein